MEIYIEGKIYLFNLGRIIKNKKNEMDFDTNVQRYCK
jgi:hypothetical protein